MNMGHDKDKTKKKYISAHNMVRAILLLCYAAVVFVALPNKSAGQSFGAALFASYRYAWYTMDSGAWRDIMLNICLFIPFGILLPAVYRHCRKAWILYSAAGFAVVIGMAQWIAGKGVFTLDDLINRLLGAIIGYGLFEAACCLAGKKRSIRPVLCLQIPLLAVAAGSAALCAIYRVQEFGNLSCHYIVRERLGDADIHVQTIFSDEEAKGMVYRMDILEQSQMDQKAEQMFEAMGTSVDDGAIAQEDGSVAYTDKSGSRKLWLDKVGGTYTYTDAQQMKDGEGWLIAGKTDATRTMIENELESLGISAPEDYAFEELGEGQYRFIAKRICREGRMYDGEMICEYNTNGKISRIDNRIRECRECKEVILRSAKEAYGDVIAGKFSRGYFASEKIQTMELRDVNVAYMQDTKNYYQPVYEIDVTINGEEAVINLPALNK